MEEYKDLDTTAMAFLGDSIYELFVRNYVISRGFAGADMLHKRAVKYVRAESQASVVRTMMKEYGEHVDNEPFSSENAVFHLYEEEVKLMKRARNKKSSSKSRSAGPVDYKLATSFEALIGYLWVNDKKERAEDIMKYAVDVIERGMRNE